MASSVKGKRFCAPHRTAPFKLIEVMNQSESELGGYIQRVVGKMWATRGRIMGRRRKIMEKVSEQNRNFYDG